MESSGTSPTFYDSPRGTTVLWIHSLINNIVLSDVIILCCHCQYIMTSSRVVSGISSTFFGSFYSYYSPSNLFSHYEYCGASCNNASIFSIFYDSPQRYYSPLNLFFLNNILTCILWLTPPNSYTSPDEVIVYIN